MKFWKYCAAGNDFILLDHRPSNLDLIDIAKLCDRRFGIGADGLLIVDQSTESLDFKMTYFNADGGEVEMCGNGARSCAHWYYLQTKKTQMEFVTNKGSIYQAKYISEGKAEVSMDELSDEEMIKTNDFYPHLESIYMNTGVPHTVVLLNKEDDLEDFRWMADAPNLRADKRFSKGCNINFIQLVNTNEINLRTFERGVEAETLACGTGAVAAARFMNKKLGLKKIKINARGGLLEVNFIDGKCWLAGPVQNTYIGDISLSDFLTQK